MIMGKRSLERLERHDHGWSRRPGRARGQWALSGVGEVAAEPGGQGWVQFGDHGPDAGKPGRQFVHIGMSAPGARCRRDLIDGRADPGDPGLPCRTHDRSLLGPVMIVTAFRPPAPRSTSSRCPRGGSRLWAGTTGTVAGPTSHSTCGQPSRCVWMSRRDEVFSPHTRWTTSALAEQVRKDLHPAISPGVSPARTQRDRRVCTSCPQTCAQRDLNAGLVRRQTVRTAEYNGVRRPVTAAPLCVHFPGRWAA